MRRIVLSYTLASSLLFASAAHAQDASVAADASTPASDGGASTTTQGDAAHQPTAEERRSVQIGRTDFEFGAGLSFFRIGALRDPSLPARTRHFEPDIRTVTTNLIFQVSIRPSGNPWRRTNEATLRSFQIFSLAPFLLLDIAKPLERSELALGFGLGLLEDAVVFGVGFSLYRGIPVRSGSGASGGDTVPTGLIAALLMSDGQITLEDLFFTVNLNVVAIGRSLLGGRTSP